MCDRSIPADIVSAKTFRRLSSGADAEARLSGEPRFSVDSGAYHVPEVRGQLAALSTGAAVRPFGLSIVPANDGELDDLWRGAVVVPHGRCNKGVFAGRRHCMQMRRHCRCCANREDRLNPYRICGSTGPAEAYRRLCSMTTR